MSPGGDSPYEKGGDATSTPFLFVWSPPWGWGGELMLHVNGNLSGLLVWGKERGLTKQLEGPGFDNYPSPVDYEQSLFCSYIRWK